MGNKIIFPVLFVFLLFTFCQKNKKNVLYDTAQRIVLIDSVSAKFESRLDSIVFLYTGMNNGKTFVRQIEYFNFGEPVMDSYFLFTDNKYLYAGKNFSSDDTIYFFPYCSFRLQDTVYYNIDNGSIEGLITYSGCTIFTNDSDSTRKEYIGTVLLHSEITPEDPTVRWAFDDSNRIEKICFWANIISYEKQTNS